MANGLNRLLTLTFAPEHLPDDRAGVWECIEDFRRKLHDHLGERIPLVVTIERGKQNGRLHAHVAYGRYLDQEAVAGLWGRGFVDLRQIRVAGEGKRAGCRRAAAYVAKYVTKDDDADRGLNGRRYSVTKGFVPVRSSRAVESFRVGVEVAKTLCGGDLEWGWSSAEDPEWVGTPCHVYVFGDP